MIVPATLPRPARRAIADYMSADYAYCKTVDLVRAYGINEPVPPTVAHLARRWGQRCDQAEAVLARHLGEVEAEELLNEIVFLDDAHWTTWSEKKAALERAPEDR